MKLNTVSSLLGTRNTLLSRQKSFLYTPKQRILITCHSITQLFRLQMTRAPILRFPKSRTHVAVIPQLEQDGCLAVGCTFTQNSQLTPSSSNLIAKAGFILSQKRKLPFFCFMGQQRGMTSKHMRSGDYHSRPLECMGWKVRW